MDLLALSRRALEAGDVPLALLYADRAVDAAPTDPVPYFHAAGVLAEAGRHAQAVDRLAAAIAACGEGLGAVEHGNLLRFAGYYRALAALARRPPPLVLQAAPGKPVPNALHVSLVKDEADIVHACLENSYRQGLRCFVLADNASGDATRAEIERFRRSRPDAVVLVVDDPIAGHHHDAKTLGLVRLATTFLEATGRPIDWIVPVDADEFLHRLDPARDLHDALAGMAASGRTVLMFYLCDAAPAAALDRLPPDADPQASCPVVALFGGRVFSKLIWRHGTAAVPWMGNHFVDGCATRVDQMAEGVGEGLLMLHYPLRSVAQVRSKVLNGFRGIEAAGLPAEMCAHWRAWHDLYLRHGEPAFAAILDRFIAETARKRRLPVEGFRLR